MGWVWFFYNYTYLIYECLPSFDICLVLVSLYLCFQKPNVELLRSNVGPDQFNFASSRRDEYFAQVGRFMASKGCDFWLNSFEETEPIEVTDSKILLTVPILKMSNFFWFEKWVKSWTSYTLLLIEDVV